MEREGIEAEAAGAAATQAQKKKVLNQADKKAVSAFNSGSRLTNARLLGYWNALPNLPPLHPSVYTNGGIGPDPGHLQFQDIPTQLSAAVRDFDVDAALKGLPAMPGSPVPAPGPVICGYDGPGK